MLTLPIYNTEGKEVDKISLEPKVFDGRINRGLLYQAVLMYRANQRKGLASTKTRGEVSGGGKKPWRQKGTGRARVGSIRTPLWRSGGIVFGPHPRNFSYSLPHKIKLRALQSSLNAKVKDKEMIVVDKIELTEPKTKEFAKILSNFASSLIIAKKRRNLLLLLDKADKKIIRATGNINFLKINSVSQINALQILGSRELIITKEALKQLTARIKSSLKEK